jgi:YtcA family
MKYLRSYPVVLLGNLLWAGCRTDAHSPTVDVLGSYFPAWIICIVIGLALTLVARQLFIGFKVDTHLRPAPLVYLCLTVLFTLTVWLLFFQN